MDVFSNGPSVPYVSNSEQERIHLAEPSPPAPPMEVIGRVEEHRYSPRRICTAVAACLPARLPENTASAMDSPLT